MKIRFLLPSVFAALLISGCGQKESASAGATAAATPAAAPAPVAGPRVIELTANDTMKYTYGDKQSGPGAPLIIEAKAGEALKITLTNNGTQPKEVMGHNFVLLKPGSDAAAFSTAATVAKDTGYIPPALKDQVLGNTELLGPRKSGEVAVTLAAGEYPFLCTFPAHFAVGMTGKIVVK
jgi:azurin